MVLPLTALIIGTSVLGAEIDDGSIVHLLATPVRRRSVVLSKFIVAVMLTVAFGAIPEYLAGAIATGPGSRLAIGLLAGALAASVIYNAIFVMLSVLTTRAIAVGLLYLLVWEGLLGNLVGGVRLLSVDQYALAITNSDRAQPEPARAPHPGDRRGHGHRGDVRRARLRHPAAVRLLAQGRRRLTVPGAGPAGGMSRARGGTVAAPAVKDLQAKRLRAGARLLSRRAPRVLQGRR